MSNHIDIIESPTGFEVRVLDDDNQLLRRFKYSTIIGARRAAEAWAAAYHNCEVRDLTSALPTAQRKRQW
jgi:hypothetical protein